MDILREMSLYNINNGMLKINSNSKMRNFSEEKIFKNNFWNLTGLKYNEKGEFMQKHKYNSNSSNKTRKYYPLNLNIKNNIKTKFLFR